MVDDFKIRQLQRKIEQIEREIKILRNGIEEEDVFISETSKGADKLANARGNLLDISEKVFSQISFLRSAEFLKSEMRSSITGSSYEAAEERIRKTRKNLEKEKEKHKKDIEELKRMKKKYERQIEELRRQMMEAN